MTSPRYLTSCDDFRAPTGADLLDSDDRRYLVDLAELTDACEPWMLAADASHGDVVGEFEVRAGHEITVAIPAAAVRVLPHDDAVRPRNATVCSGDRGGSS